MLIVWMIFCSKLLSLFSVSALYTLFSSTYATIQTDKRTSLKNYYSGLGFDRLGATNFLILCEIATFVWVATHTMGTIGFNA